MIYTHVANRADIKVVSPLDRLAERSKPRTGEPESKVDRHSERSERDECDGGVDFELQGDEIDCGPLDRRSDNDVTGTTYENASTETRPVRTANHRSRRRTNGGWLRRFARALVNA